MIYAMVLAGGVGSRMGKMEKPKQYLEIGKKPILIHTLEKFVVHDSFEKILVLCPQEWMEYTKQLIEKHLAKQSGAVIVLEGGDSRNETIMRGIDYIEAQGHLDEETLIVTHDSVRPFLTYRMIEENIVYGKKYGAADTVIKATDTIVQSMDGLHITKVPERSKMYQGQTPQTFRAKKLKELYTSLTQQEREILTDASKIFVLKGEPVYLVQGEVFNIKITYPYDLQVAQSLLNL